LLRFQERSTTAGAAAVPDAPWEPFGGSGTAAVAPGVVSGEDWEEGVLRVLHPEPLLACFFLFLELVFHSVCPPKKPTCATVFRALDPLVVSEGLSRKYWGAERTRGFQASSCAQNLERATLTRRVCGVQVMGANGDVFDLTRPRAGSEAGERAERLTRDATGGRVRASFPRRKGPLRCCSKA
jgi:hypothetical protein